jgi:hypothetical protein
MIENIYSWAFLYNKLSTDAVLTGETALAEKKIYQGYAPEGTEHPFIIGDLLSSVDNNSLMSRVQVNQLWQVRVVVKGALSATARRAANRLDELLREVRNEVLELDDARFVFHVWREQSISRFEQGETADFTYRHVGGIYRLQVYEAD